MSAFHLPFSQAERGVRPACLRGAISVIDLLPQTRYDRWVRPCELSAGRSLLRDWYMVGGDIFQAMLKQGVIEQVRVNSTIEPDCVGSTSTS
jgi:hypothetical protein